MKKLILIFLLIPSLCFGFVQGKDLLNIGDIPEFGVPAVGWSILPQQSFIQVFWQFEEASGTLYDQTTNDYDLIAGNASTYHATGIVDYATSWNGTSNYMIHNNCNLLSGWDEMTAMFWLKTPASVDTTTQKPITLLDSAGHYALLFYKHTDNKFRFYVSTADSDYRDILAANVVSANTWYCIILRYKRNTTNGFNVLINNIPETDIENTGDYPLDTTGDTFTVGRMANTAESYWEGLIDEGIIWNKYLTDEECSEVYTNTYKAYYRYR